MNDNEPINLYVALADHGEEIPPGVAIMSAYGGGCGIAFMILVAAAIGAMLAIGGVL